LCLFLTNVKSQNYVADTEKDNGAGMEQLLYMVTRKKLIVKGIIIKHV